MAYAFIGVGAGAYLFYRGFKHLRLKRIIEDTPLSQIRSIAIGPVEVKGEAVPIFKVCSPFSQTVCTYYRYRVQKFYRVNNMDYWDTVAQGDSSQYPFFLEDETGCILVNPLKADVDIPWADVYKFGSSQSLPPEAARFLEENNVKVKGWFVNKLIRLQEICILPRQPVYVLGYAAAWKMKPDSAAAKSMENIRLHKRLITENMTVIRQNPEGGVFYISAMSRKNLVQELKTTVFLSIFGGAALTLVCLFFILAALDLL